MLQAGRRGDGTTPEFFISDFFDFSIYVDAAERDIRQWYVERFLALRRTSFQDTRPTSAASPGSPTSRRRDGDWNLGGGQRAQPARQHRAHH